MSTAKYVAPRLIAGFVASRGKVELRFLIGNRDAPVERTARSKWLPPVVRRATCRSRPSLLARILTSSSPRLAIGLPAPRGWPAKADLAGEAFLFREIGSGTRSLFDDFIGDTAIKSVQMGMELSSNETINQAVIAGLEIALISAHTIAAEVDDGRLVASTSRDCRSFAARS